MSHMPSSTTVTVPSPMQFWSKQTGVVFWQSWESQSISEQMVEASQATKPSQTDEHSAEQVSSSQQDSTVSWHEGYAEQYSVGDKVPPHRDRERSMETGASGRRFSAILKTPQWHRFKCSLSYRLEFDAGSERGRRPGVGSKETGGGRDNQTPKDPVNGDEMEPWGSWPGKYPRPVVVKSLAPGRWGPWATQSRRASYIIADQGGGPAWPGC
ncbi:predicted protein [Histoplasma mississippiense (nom. inval.)]|uniref:predicted protein n=1 Tax=Ajellomyces capsulatus (strain NAm1 / WU24) TaxID=2059318 RepID=UPI000157BFD1|nr:predicted protein [Histoplasma mississippiense (nom. inval.)]EDN06828.1 predicted protein [Histoplasma mississippiense (nom. inval.)]